MIFKIVKIIYKNKNYYIFDYIDFFGFIGRAKGYYDNHLEFFLNQILYMKGVHYYDPKYGKTFIFEHIKPYQKKYQASYIKMFKLKKPEIIIYSNVRKIDKPMFKSSYLFKGVNNLISGKNDHINIVIDNKINRRIHSDKYILTGYWTEFPKTFYCTNIQKDLKKQKISDEDLENIIAMNKFL